MLYILIVMIDNCKEVWLLTVSDGVCFCLLLRFKLLLIDIQLLIKRFVPLHGCNVNNFSWKYSTEYLIS